MRHDLRLARRSLLAHKGFALAAVVTLALGIGASTAMFSVAYGVLMRPLPYPDAASLVMIGERQPDGTRALGNGMLTNATYHAWLGHSQTLEAIATYDQGPSTVGLDVPVRMIGSGVSPSLFALLRVAPAAGRLFTDADASSGAPAVVVLSDRFWREAFGARLDAIGRSLTIDRQPHTIVGVAPASFAFPDRAVRFWTPSVMPRSVDGDITASLAVARLRRGATPAEAATEGTAIARVQPRSPREEQFWGRSATADVEVRRVAEGMTAAVRPILVICLAGAVCLLLIACTNVANLLLSRGASRSRELGVLQALGATRTRIVRQLLIESGILALCAGVLGVALAAAVVRALPAVAPPELPRLDDVRVDWAMATFAAAISMLAGVFAGLMPALQIGRGPARALRSTAASTTRHSARTRRSFLVAEAALAMLLLVVATLVGRSFSRLLQINPGYDATNVLTARLFMPGAQLRPGEADQFAAALLGRIRSVPTVRSAGAGWMTPFGGSTSSNIFTIAAGGRPAVSARALVNVVTPGYQEALGIQLRRGRLLNESDLLRPRQSLVVNEAFVETFLSGVEPIGTNVGVVLSRGVEAEVVGVVRNVLRDGLQSVAMPEVYLVPAHRYTVGGELKLVVRSDSDPAALAGIVRQLVRDLRQDTAVDNVLPLSLQLSDSVRKERLATTTMATFAVMAMMLAAMGLYGVLSYSVSVRQREMGIRSALGADRGDLVWLVVRDGMGVAIAGLLLGLAAGGAAARVLQSVLTGVEALDAVAFVAAPAVLAVVALLACLLPARRAAAVDPAVALRCE